MHHVSRFTFHVSRFTPHASRSQRGVALIVTLLLLSIITFMTVTFLVVSRSQKGSVVTETDQAIARLAADTALERAKAELLAGIMGSTNEFNYGLLVSKNYINSAGFISGNTSPYNASYNYPNGATWPPSVVHREWWSKVGGYSAEFSPGMSSDNDFSMKLWAAGCRIFLGVGRSQVYHFMSRSTGKVVRNNGRKQFLHKWGMTQSTFDTHFLRRGQLAQAVILPEPAVNARYVWDRFRGLMRLMWWRF